MSEIDARNFATDCGACIVQITLKVTPGNFERAPNNVGISTLATQYLKVGEVGSR